MNLRDVEILNYFFKNDDQKSEVLAYISNALTVSEDEISDFEILEQGMTNHAFTFLCGNNEKYIMRIPGEGTEHLIDRKQEAAVYQVIAEKKISDEVIDIEPVSGYKLTRFLENARVCNPLDGEDVRKCMNWLRKFHEMGVEVEHEFDIFKKINFYESLWNGNSSVYSNYKKVKKHVFSLQGYIIKYSKRKSLCHIDAVPDNFLFIVNGEGKEKIRLLDWEYAGMQDPLVDIAMFCIYSFYDKTEVDRTISEYFPEGCKVSEKVLIYCYIAACGLLWSNWCEYKRILGIDFGEYSLRQYRYAEDYYRIVCDELVKAGENI